MGPASMVQGVRAAEGAAASASGSRVPLLGGQNAFREMAANQGYLPLSAHPKAAAAEQGGNGSRLLDGADQLEGSFGAEGVFNIVTGGATILPVHQQGTWFKVAEDGAVESMLAVKRALQGLQDKYGIQKRDLRVLDSRFHSVRDTGRIMVRDQCIILAMDNLYVIICEAEVFITTINDLVNHEFLPRLQKRLKTRAKLEKQRQEDVRLAKLQLQMADNLARGAKAGPASPVRSSKPGVHPLEAQSEHGSDAEEDDVSLPFELLVLEVALNTVTKIMEKQLDNFEESTFGILDQFRKFPERSENLEKLGALKNRQSRLEFRLEAHTEIFERLLDDQEDMLRMVLSRHREEEAAGLSDADVRRSFKPGMSPRVSNITSSSRNRDAFLGDSPSDGGGADTKRSASFDLARGAADPENDLVLMYLDTVENLLEHFYAIFDRSWDRCKTIDEYIENTETVTSIGIDTARNGIIKLELTLTAMTFATSIMTLVGGLYGENVPLPGGVKESPTAFVVINGLAAVVCVLMYLGIWSYCKARRLL